MTPSKNLTNTNTNDDTLALHRAVYAARPSAREAIEKSPQKSPLAQSFIIATQEYQVSLLAHAAKHAANVPAYWSARADFVNASPCNTAARLRAEDALVRSEAELCQRSPALSERRDAMLQTGKAYMRATPALALTLDLPPATRAWNHVKMFLKL